MKFQYRLLTAVAISLLPFSMFAKENVLQLFENNKYQPVEWSRISEIGFNSAEGTMSVLTKDGETSALSLDDDFNISSGTSIPLLEITTDEEMEEITSKTEYSAADFKLSSFGEFEDADVRVDIRGRGNSSWKAAKKPYRLKFNKKISLCGLNKAKSYVLLASWTDSSLLQFALATKIGHLLGLPYTNSVQPVDLIFNGIYKGSYILTNKTGINSGSVDIDESTSVMWELDYYFNEDIRFRSNMLNLPVNLADPDMDEESFERWKADFNEMELAVMLGSGADYVDMEIFARYLLVCDILQNGEIGWPKSVKLYKTEGGKYNFGPIWDFDLCMGANWETGEEYTTTDINKPAWRNTLFSYLQDYPAAIAERKRCWEIVKENLPEIMQYIDDYAASIRQSAMRNRSVWPSFKEFDTSVANLKSWLSKRMEVLDTLIAEQ